ncbi:MAG: 2-phospho-L-lactate transferase [Acidimicrobiia bacterium]|nr:2-phospho-L-lactate transferase [Acidimicrobiia bacterium]
MNEAIQGPNSDYSNPFAVLLTGGVGGARAARSLNRVFTGERLTVVGNVGDDELIHGVHVSADLDTVLYTLAGIEGPHGWGIGGDSFSVMDHLETLGVDTTFRLGDRDLATCLFRTGLLASGNTLSDITQQIRLALGVETRVLPATDDPVRTRVRIADGSWLPFQEYFVARGHRDHVLEVEYTGAEHAVPGPGVVEAIAAADVVVIAPSNPPLSIGPIIAVPEIRRAIADKERVVAISPLFGGKALKGPAERVLASLGFPPGNAGVLASYEGLISDVVVDIGDATDVRKLSTSVMIHATNTRLGTEDEARRFAEWFQEAFA